MFFASKIGLYFTMYPVADLPPPPKDEDSIESNSESTITDAMEADEDDETEVVGCRGEFNPFGGKDTGAGVESKCKTIGWIFKTI